MKSEMQQMQEMMQQENQMQTFTDMMRLIDNTLALSKQQEELKSQLEKMDSNSSQFEKNVQKQNEIKKNLNKLMEQMSELSKKSFTISPEMGKALGDANRKMDQSMQEMQNRNGSMSSLLQGDAMMNLNEAASMMKNSLESMMQGGSGSSGMMSLMQQLQKLSGQQMDLNNMTQMLQQMQNGQLSPQQQGEIQRMAQQQQMIQKSLEELNKEAKQSGESKKIPADLENIVNQMSEVITNMNSEKLNDELVQKQEKILSKLLDAQRSLNERDFEKERKSDSGKFTSMNSPAELNLSNQKGKEKIKDALNRAVQEGYNKDYENLIRKYYEALEKEKISN
jgi:Skp family chaperone for outer membrane proteins